MVAFLRSWSLRLGLLLLIPAALYLPWRQELLWRSGDVVVPIRALRYRFVWDRPWNANIAVGRLTLEFGVLVVIVALAYQFEKSGKPQRAVVPALTLRYSEADWQSERQQLDAGSDPGVCPICERTGFYGPRDDGAGRRYRKCVYCGLLQNVGEAPVQLRACVHDCGAVPTVAGTPMITWVEPDKNFYTCDGCGREVDVDVNLATGPADDPGHPWRSVPQGLSQREYVRFWLAHGAPGRTFL